MTLIEFVAGLLIAVVVGLLYYITLLVVDNAALKKCAEDRLELLTESALKITQLSRKLEKINELTRL